MNVFLKPEQSVVPHEISSQVISSIQTIFTKISKQMQKLYKSITHCEIRIVLLACYWGSTTGAQGITKENYGSTKAN